MKKLLSILLCVALMGCLAVPAFAATPAYDAGEFTVYYQIQSQYSIWIPEDVPLNQETRLEAELLNITPVEQVNVRVTNLVNDKLKLSDEYGNQIEVKLNNEDGLIGVFTDNVESDITFFAQDEGGKAGLYSGVIEFSIELAPRAD